MKDYNISYAIYILDKTKMCSLRIYLIKFVFFSL